MEQFFDSLDRDKVKTLTLQWSKAVKNVAYSFNKDSFVTNKRDAELVFYFDRDDCSKGALIGHDDEEGFIFPVENKNLSEISLDKIPTNKSKTKVGFRPMTKDKEGLGFWVKTTSGRFVLAVIKKVEPQEFKNFDGGAEPKSNWNGHGKLFKLLGYKKYNEILSSLFTLMPDRQICFC